MGTSVWGEPSCIFPHAASEEMRKAMNAIDGMKKRRVFMIAKSKSSIIQLKANGEDLVTGAKLRRQDLIQAESRAGGQAF